MVNIISWTNAGKREFGESHWFWAVWIGLDASEIRQQVRWSSAPFNGEEPTECGFLPSKAAARRAAWACIERRVPVKSERRAYPWSWAWDYLRRKQENDNRPSFSRCKIGKDKWLWVVFRRGGWSNEEQPLARGIADTAEAAYQSAVEAVGPIRQAGNSLANSVREKEAAVKRSQRTTDRKDAASLEFVYECHPHYSDHDGSESDSVIPYRIVKKTRKYIFVDREPWRESAKLSGDWRDFQQRTFVLDRAEFERTGKAGRSKWWYGTYYADPAIYYAESKATAFRPECFIVLDLAADASRDAIHKAYRRLARQTHPDHGGDSEEFKRVRKAYEDALAFAARV